MLTRTLLVTLTIQREFDRVAHRVLIFCDCVARAYLLHWEMRKWQVWSGLPKWPILGRLCPIYFANSSLIFCDAYLVQCRKLKEIWVFMTMQRVSSVIFDKLVVSFSLNTERPVWEEILLVIEIYEVHCREQYNGVTTEPKRDKMTYFRYFGRNVCGD